MTNSIPSERLNLPNSPIIRGRFDRIASFTRGATPSSFAPGYKYFAPLGLFETTILIAQNEYFKLTNVL